MRTIKLNLEDNSKRVIDTKVIRKSDKIANSGSFRVNAVSFFIRVS